MSIEDLIKRCETAHESRQWDAIIDAAGYATRQGWIDADTYDQLDAFLEAGAFVDAALLLVPEGLRWDVSGYTKNGAAWVGSPESHFREFVTAATPALALTAANLRAHQVMEKSDAE